MTKTVEQPCVIEAIGDEVIIECGSAAATLTGDVAHDAGVKLQEQGAVARSAHQSAASG